MIICIKDLNETNCLTVEHIITQGGYFNKILIDEHNLLLLSKCNKLKYLELRNIYMTEDNIHIINQYCNNTNVKLYCDINIIASLKYYIIIKTNQKFVIYTNYYKIFNILPSNLTTLVVNPSFTINKPELLNLPYMLEEIYITQDYYYIKLPYNCKLLPLKDFSKSLL